jgi:TPR repeat protein
MACHNCAEFFAVIHSDHVRAKSLYEKNCSKNNFAPSCFNLAKLFLSGKKDLGIKRDDVQAQELFSKACAGGHNPACFHEGTMLFTATKAKLAAVNKAAASDTGTGTGTGPTWFGSFGGASTSNSNSNNLTQDMHRSLELLTRSCYGGIADSCYNAASYWLRPDKLVPPFPSSPPYLCHLCCCHCVAVTLTDYHRH